MQQKNSKVLSDGNLEMISLVVTLFLSIISGKGSAFSLSSLRTALNVRKSWQFQGTSSLLMASTGNSPEIANASYYHWDSSRDMVYDMESVTSLLVAINVFMFLLQWLIPSLTSRLMKSDSSISRGQIYRLLSSTFLHSNLQHLMANTASLYSIGSQVLSLFNFDVWILIIS